MESVRYKRRYGMLPRFVGSRKNEKSYENTFAKTPYGVITRHNKTGGITSIHNYDNYDRRERATSEEHEKSLFDPTPETTCYDGEEESE